MLVIGNDELDAAPQIGKTVKCWMCGKQHKVRFGKEEKDGVWEESDRLAYFKCGGHAYLCGINGVEVRPTVREDSDGTVPREA